RCMRELDVLEYGADPLVRGRDPGERAHERLSPLLARPAEPCDQSFSGQPHQRAAKEQCLRPLEGFDEFCARNTAPSMIAVRTHRQGECRAAECAEVLELLT